MLQALGAELLVRLMAADGGLRPDLGWLLFGPTDPAVVHLAEDEPPPLLLAAE